MSINWSLDVEPAPGLLVLPPAAASLDDAHAAIELWEHYSGSVLHPTQRLAVEVMMAQRADGKWAASTTGREMPRQNGKGVEIEVVELYGLVHLSEAILHTIHDAVLLATEAQSRLMRLLDKPDLRRKVKRVWRGTGQQMVEMRDGGMIWYRTRTGGGGRGVDDVDRLVIDEAQHATEEHLAAVAPTLLANKNPQMNAMGTSALEGKSAWWWGIRKRALSDDPGSFGYLGHTAERVYLDADGRVVQEPIDASDRKLWAVANPAMKAGRSDVAEFLEEQFRNLSPTSFAQEHLGVWSPPVENQANPKLPIVEWRACRIPVEEAQRLRDRPGPVLSFDVDIDGASASTGIATGSIVDPYVQMLDHRSQVGWLADRLVELVQRTSPTAVAYNAAGPALAQVGAIQVAFREAGLSTDLLVPLTSADYGAACGGLLADVTEGRLKRPAEQQSLDLAGEDAAERLLGERWVWDRRQATVPISPLVAVTVARFLLPVEVASVDPVANVW